MKKCLLNLVFFLLILFAFITNLQSVYSEVIDNLFTTQVIKPKSDNNLKNVSATLLNIDQSLIKKIHYSNELTIKNVPLDNSTTKDIQLTRVNSIVDENTKILTGDETPIKMREISRFKGTLLNEPGSEVFLTIVNDALILRIKKGNGSEFMISPSFDNTNQYLCINQSNYSPKKPFLCNSEEPAELYKQFNKQNYNKVLSNKILQVNIGVEICKDLYNQMNNDTNKVINYVLSLYSIVSFFYEKEINITINISYLKIWTTPDPYNGDGNPNTIINTAPVYWQSHFMNLTPDLVHILTTAVKGNVEGISNFNAVDGGSDHNWAGVHVGRGFMAASIHGTYNYPSYDYSDDLYNVTHEMGHNFNCPHTHSCFWNPPLDTCWIDTENSACVSLSQPIYSPGSIMSYCRALSAKGSRMTFLNKPATFIRNYAETTPLKEVSTAFIRLLSPQDSLQYTTYKKNDPIPIKWISSKISSITIDYSSDNGKTWNLVASNVNASSGVYYWIAPDKYSTNYKIKVFSGSTLDTTKGTFTIIGSPDKIALTIPANNSKNQQTNLTLKWEKNLQATTYNIQICTNNFIYFNGLVVNDSLVQDTTYIAKGLEDTTQYYWRVKALSSLYGNGAFSDVWQFKTGFATDKIFLAKPNNNSTNQPTNTTFSWGKNSTAEYYHLQLSTNNIFDISGLVVNDSLVQDTTYYKPDLKDTTNFYWRVRMGNSTDGYGKFSDVWQFLTGYSPLAMPDLLLPYNNGQTTIKPLFTWVCSSGNPEHYELQIANKVNQNNFDSSAIVFDNKSIKADSVQLTGSTLLFNTTYYWRIKAYKAIIESPWSAIKSFVTSLPDDVDEIELANKIEIYPNPLNNILNISFKNPASNNVSIELYNALGNPVYKDIIQNSSNLENHYSIDVSKFINGVYCVRFNINSQIINKMIMIYR